MHRGYALAFALLGGSLFAMGFLIGGAGLLLGWPGISMAWVSRAYFVGDALSLGKDASSGRLHPVARVGLAPYLLLTWGVWHAARWVSAERPCDEVVDGVYVGRRLFRSEVPGSVVTVVDLTAEFAALPQGDVAYVALPWLDAASPTPEVLARRAREVASLPRPVLIHCAQGHGRTSLMAALVLLVDGVASDPDEALGLIARARPLAVPNAHQRVMLERASALL